MPEAEYKRCPQCKQDFKRDPRRSATQWASQRFCSHSCSRSHSATTHGATKGGLTPEYYSWTAMKARCLNPNAFGYESYGGRGIMICERWRFDFPAFLADMGERPAGHSLDRIDVNGNYEPGNCRWATAKEQMQNRRPIARAPKPPCQIFGCDRTSLIRGLCGRHYQQQRTARLRAEAS